jgi:hypothetical protein
MRFPEARQLAGDTMVVGGSQRGRHQRAGLGLSHGGDLREPDVDGVLGGMADYFPSL